MNETQKQSEQEIVNDRRLVEAYKLADAARLELRKIRRGIVASMKRVA
jgi:hypothetical protein